MKKSFQIPVKQLFFSKNVLYRATMKKHTSQAEVDFVLQFDSKVIPTEVKLGHNARLKLLHLFMDEAPHYLGVSPNNPVYLIIQLFDFLHYPAESRHIAINHRTHFRVISCPLVNYAFGRNDADCSGQNRCRKPSRRRR
ncbi:MAG: DUF4143 domain-containing protein [Dysgonamonadaceae bacterium]|jgi:hypothetical protein|nr:DUF4143 domain-containing protein [Dysgonamonadaceae bacterium]